MTKLRLTGCFHIQLLFIQFFMQVKLAEIKKEYDALIEPLEALYIKRPPKPAPAPPKPAEEAKPAEPAPAAVEAPAPAAVTA